MTTVALPARGKSGEHTKAIASSRAVRMWNLVARTKVVITETVALAVGVAEFEGRTLQLLVQGHPGSWALHVLGKVSLPLDLFLTAEPHLQLLAVIVSQVQATFTLCPLSGCSVSLFTRVYVCEDPPSSDLTWTVCEPLTICNKKFVSEKYSDTISWGIQVQKN